MFFFNGLVEYCLFDFIMMYFVVRNVCFDKIELNKFKWGKILVFGDKSFFVVIEIIWGCRNIFFVYVIEVKFYDLKFEELWIDLEFVVNKIYEFLG